MVANIGLKADVVKGKSEERESNIKSKFFYGKREKKMNWKKKKIGMETKYWNGKRKQNGEKEKKKNRE